MQKQFKLLTLRGVPTTVILNKDRDEIARIIGKLDFNDEKFISWINDILSSKKINLVYGGGSNGLMGEIARTMQQNGSSITGIIPKFLETEENMNKKADKLIVVKDMAKRKKNIQYI